MLFAIFLNFAVERQHINMVIIADSGSTKTHWAIIQNGAYDITQTAGINPVLQTKNEIIHILNTSFQQDVSNIDEIYFYGTGCRGEHAQKLELCLKSFFTNARHIEVHSDIIGAARALFGKNKGIACILGTGSNTCYYDGRSTTTLIPSLGFILGDEGSGAYLGKLVINNLLKNQLGEELKQKFFDKYSITIDDIINHVYSQPFPNRFLASFAQFINEHKTNPRIQQLLIDAFDAFFQKNIIAYSHFSRPVGIVGSIGYYFQDEIKQVAKKYNIKISKIIQSPIKELIYYHEKM